MKPEIYVSEIANRVIENARVDGQQLHSWMNGEQLQKSGKSYGDYLDEKKKKAERDDRHKDLQIEDLETKLRVMNQAQLDFWKAQKQKNVQTTVIAIISAVLSLISMFKSFGFL